MGVKVAVAIVTNRQVKPMTVLSLMEMLNDTDHEIVPIVATEGFTIAENRSYCVFRAVNEGCSHLLFIDDDMVFPKHTLSTLLLHDKAVVGVASNSRTLPLSPTVALIQDIEGQDAPLNVGSPEDLPKEPFKCYSVGMGVALIDLKWVEKMKQPYFDFITAPSGKVTTGEDEYFCNQIRELGGEIWCDPTFEIGHIGEYTY